MQGESGGAQNFAPAKKHKWADIQCIDGPYSQFFISYNRFYLENMSCLKKGLASKNSVKVKVTTKKVKVKLRWRAIQIVLILDEWLVEMKIYNENHDDTMMKTPVKPLKGKWDKGGQADEQLHLNINSLLTFI